MNKLRKYIENELMPTKPQIDFCNGKIRTFQNLFANGTSLRFKQCRPSGSFKKGTMLRNRFELDIVMVLERQGFNFNEVKAEVQRLVKDNMPNMRIKQIGNVSIQLLSSFQNKLFSMDVVPTFLVNSPLQASEVKDAAAYQGATSIWHMKYIREQKKFPGYVELVLLIKDWVQKNKVPLKSFFVELIVASAIEYRDISINKSLQHNLRECMKEIMAMTDGSPIYPVNWKYFDETHYDIQSSKAKAVIIDPANPRDNLGKKLSLEDLKQIRSLASKKIHSLC